MNVKIDDSWKEILNDEFAKDYFVNLTDFVRNEYQTKTIYPPASKIFSAFNHTSFDDVKVVLIGQDPYHGAGQANGLSFSVADGVKSPPSLRNIYKELYDDLGIQIPASGNLEPWAKQGVLMLNATLTVEASNAGSHQKKGWEEFTDAVIQSLSDKKENLVFILWGAYAQKKGERINRNKHFVIESAHPSPFAAHRGFFGSKPFSKTNDFLKSKNLNQINWNL
ncbi:Uracil-DNA glycosylase [Chishuiella changwenlii]|uniref:Uracil-DNA glycosylase n=1 Tax=Chishuiella changwenlii TaxID=1434701 RepID=A0A1M6YA71_9FLAO|nr:uracil-DNA glycosylase [Chishuiella changwenlii]GGE93057.1 uracil-DNA glycosylase 2 [Chishuiella changwenlii]SHL14905.1 Uracil-DNA glycosylase [Chishuiella changwenlii]